MPGVRCAVCHCRFRRRRPELRRRSPARCAGVSPVNTFTGVSVSSVNSTSSKVRVPRIASGLSSHSSNGSFDDCSDIESRGPEWAQPFCPRKQDLHISWETDFSYSSIGLRVLRSAWRTSPSRTTYRFARTGNRHFVYPRSECRVLHRVRDSWTAFGGTREWQDHLHSQEVHPHEFRRSQKTS